MDNLENYFLSSSAILYLANYKPRLPRRYVAHDDCKSRPTESEYIAVFLKLKNCNDETKFFEYMRMCKNTFEYISKRIEKYDRRSYHNCHGRPIMMEERLVVTIQYLATGMSFRRLAFSFKMGNCTVSKIVGEIVKILWDEFSPIHMPPPTVEHFRQIGEEYYQLWNIPHCIGAIDGKHVRLKNPPHSGGMFYNYKNFFSIVLQGLVDANYKFICIDVGNYGKQSDAGTFRYSSLFRCLNTGSLKIPEEEVVPEGDMKLPFVIVGDDAYPLLPYLLKPFSGDNISEEKRNFNKRLSRARRSVEHAFGLIVAKWRILKKDIETGVDKAVDIVKCICLLHNIIIDKEGMEHNQSSISTYEKKLKKKKSSGRPSGAAKDVREEFCKYFNVHRIIWEDSNNYVFDNDYDYESDENPDSPDTDYENL